MLASCIVCTTPTTDLARWCPTGKLLPLCATCAGRAPERLVQRVPRGPGTAPCGERECGPAVPCALQPPPEAPTHYYTAEECSISGGLSAYTGLPCTLVSRFGGTSEAGFNCFIRLHVTAEELAARYKRTAIANGDAKEGDDVVLPSDLESSEAVVREYGPGIYIEAHEGDDLTPVEALTPEQIAAIKAIVR